MVKSTVSVMVLLLLLCWARTAQPDRPISIGTGANPKACSLHPCCERVFPVNKPEGRTAAVRKDPQRIPFCFQVQKARSDGRATTVPKSPTLGSRQTNAPDSPERGPVVIAIERTRTSFLSVPVKLGDRRLYLAIDTGAPVTCFDKERTKGLLQWKPLAKQADNRFFQAIDTIAVVRELHIGPIRIENLRVAQMIVLTSISFWPFPLTAPFDGVLGNDILIKCRAMIDFSDFRLYLHPTTGK